MINALVIHFIPKLFILRYDLQLNRNNDVVCLALTMWTFKSVRLNLPRLSNLNKKSLWLTFCKWSRVDMDIWFKKVNDGVLLWFSRLKILHCRYSSLVCCCSADLTQELLHAMATAGKKRKGMTSSDIITGLISGGYWLGLQFLVSDSWFKF